MKRILAGLALALIAGCAHANLLPDSHPFLAPHVAQSFHIDPLASQPLAAVAADHAPGSCHVRLASNGMQLPDALCTPGAINPTVTADVLRDPTFRTGTVRDQLTTAAQKQIVYAWYGIVKPKGNVGANQTCEIDHLVSLGLGGSDALENLWPECGPSNVPVGQREFKIKDAVAELSLMKQVKAGADLADIQHRIADDWTQFIPQPGAK
jgi:hypothetical protein